MSNYDVLVQQAMPQFVKIAERHKLVQWQEECQFALQAVKSSARLQECDSESIQNAIINVAAVGLTLNPAHGYAYLVPESVKVMHDGKEQWLPRCHLRVSFKGIIKLANDSGVAKWVKADVVKKNDSFTYNGAWALPTHQMDPFGERGQSIGVYCVIKTQDGEYLCDVAPWSEVMKAKAAAKTSSVWDKWEDEMAKKFIIKRAAKQWPKSGSADHLSQAIGVIDSYEGSKEINKADEIAATLLEYIHGEYSDDEKAGLISEAWGELTDDEKATLWTAKTKGGWFTIPEKDEIRRFNSMAASARQQIEGAAA